ncbi:MAG: baseplate J/gp47 family protein [Hyphomicrobiales bacterium]
MTREPPLSDLEDDDQPGFDPDPDGLASVIDVDRADDIASICGRVDTAPTFAVVVYAPRGNRPLSTELGMRRLHRHAEESGKVVAVATSNIALANRARQVGIPTARRPEHIRWDAAGKRVVRLGNRSIILPALGGWIQLAAILAVVAIFAGLAVTMAPSATIRVIPPVETLSETVTITASSDFTEIDLAELQVPAATIESTRSITLTQRTTGKTLVGTLPAKVVVTITNPTARDVLLPAGATLLAGPEFIPFLLDAETAVAAGQTVTGGATAADPGVQGNVPAGSVTGWLDPDLRTLQVTNAEAAAGGASEERPAVDANDIVALNQLARDIERSDAIKGYVLETRPHDAVFLGTAVAEVTAGQPSATVGTPTDVVFMEVNVRVTALAVLAETLEEVARSVLGAQQGVGEFIPGSVTAVETGARQLNADDNTIKTDLKVSGQFARNLTRDAIKGAVKGKSPDDAKSTLTERYGIQEPQVDLSPGWAPWLPRFDFRLDVELMAEPEAEAPATTAAEGDGTAATATPTPRP